jgi:Uma2 family endonuclease
MATAEIPAEQRLRLSCIPWKTYVTYSDDLGPRHIRVTYDQGEMEVMTLSPKHGRKKTRLARMVEALTEEMETDIAGLGSMTCRREDSLRGLEPDECFWIQNERAVRDRDQIDLEVDPPPDLAIEVEISRSSMDRMAIYAALRVPEVWRWDGTTLRVCLLTPDGTYRQSNRSRSFPFLPLDQFATFLTKTGVSETQLVRSFRKWVREQIARDWKPAKGKSRRSTE